MLRIASICCIALCLLAQGRCQEDLRVRVDDLESQVRRLTDEVVLLRQALRSQQKISEISRRPGDRQDALYDELASSYKREAAEDGEKAFFRRLIHSHVWLGGYAELKVQDTESLDDPDLFDLSGIALSLRSSFHPDLSAHLEIGFADEKVDIHHAYLLLSLHPLLNGKAGVIRVPWGRYNSLYAPPSEPLGSVPAVDRLVVPTIWGDPGISLFGRHDLPSATISYELLMSNGFGEGGFSSIDGNREGRQSLRVDNNHEPQWSGRLEIVPRTGIEVFSLYFGVSGIFGRYDDRKNCEFTAGAVDGFLKIGPFSLVGDHDRIEVSGECAWLSAESDATTLARHPDASSRMWGYYVQLHYGFFPENWRDEFPLFGQESRFGVTLRHEKTDLDTGTRGASRADDQSATTLGFAFWPISESVFRLEYAWIRERIEHWGWENRIQASFATHF